MDLSDRIFNLRTTRSKEQGRCQRVIRCKRLRNQGIGELRLDSLTKLSTVNRQFRLSADIWAGFFRRTVSVAGEAGFGVAEQFIQVTAR